MASAASNLIEHVRKFVPAMSQSMHKGQAGKIGVLGGSKEYTGAPYYAAYSSLKVVRIFLVDHKLL